MKLVRKPLWYLVISLMLIIYSESLFSQMPEWINLTDGRSIKSLVDDGNNVWIGTEFGGISRLQKSNNTWFYYNKANSNLPDNFINDLAIDANGYKWIGTRQRGLVRFDGSNWVNYNTSNSSIPSNNVSSIAVDSRNHIWAGTNNGLAKFDGTNWTIYNSGNSPFLTNIINDVAAQDTIIWVATQHGVYRFNGSTWQNYNTLNSGLPDMLVLCIAIEPNGNKWFGTNIGGVAKFDNLNWTVYNTGNSALPSNQVTSIAFEDTTKWFGTVNGLAHFDGTNWTIYNTTNSRISNNVINAILVDANRTKWIGTADSLNKFDGTTWNKYDPSHSGIYSNTVRCITQDRFGAKWIATSKGLTKYTGNQWTLFNVANSAIPSDDVYVTAIDSKNIKWVGTALGLGKYNDTVFTVYNKNNSGLPENKINDITIDNNDVLWIATENGGLAKLDKTTWTVYNTLNSNIPSDIVNFVKIDRQGNKWVGTNAGLAKFDGTDWTVYHTGNSGLPNNNVTSIAFSTGRIKWIGTNGGGLARFNDSSFTVYNIGNSNLPENNITALYLQGSVLWFGTASMGFGSFVDTTWTIFKIDNSKLPHNSIRCIYVDLSGNKWISTNGGGLTVYRQNNILPSLFTHSVAKEYCADDIVQVYFTAFWNFNTGNIFTAQLSDSLGSFTNPVNIGTLSATTSSYINARIPRNTTYSNKYRIRVIGSNPSIINLDNGEDITIYSLPKPQILGANVVCATWEATYYVDNPQGMMNKWSVTNGTIIGDNDRDTLIVKWGTAKVGTIKLVQTASAGCKDSVTLSITINPMPGKTILGSKRVCVDRFEVYSTIDDPRYFNEWRAVGGTVINKPNYDKVKVLWEKVGKGKLKLIQTSPEGCTDSIEIDIDIFPSPTASFTGETKAYAGKTLTYTAPAQGSGITIQWKAFGGTITGPANTRFCNVQWGIDGKGGTGIIRLIVTNTSGCKDSVELSVKVFDAISFIGDREVCEDMEYVYETTSNQDAVSTWQVSGGTMLSSGSDRIIRVKWGAPDAGSIKLKQFLAGYNLTDSIVVPIKINPKPPKPTITESKGTLYSSVIKGNQWYYNGNKIPGAVGNTYFHQERSGFYSVQVTDDNGCVSEMSDPFNFVSSVQEFGESGIFQIYPNPSNGITKLNINNQAGNQLRFRILNNLGQVINYGNLTPDSDFYSTELNLEGISSGNYVIQIELNNKLYIDRLIIIK
ncbi:MAG: T9SS type A sorting domain-containing protein [Candidatus Kapabacteria bacterium]|nr:T9SS type A sorting domain-containing protein [Candidatus Kapabacteria bacterium]